MRRQCSSFDFDFDSVVVLSLYLTNLGEISLLNAYSGMESFVFLCNEIGVLL